VGVIVSKIHWIIIFWVSFSLYTIYTEQEEKRVAKIDKLPSLKIQIKRNRKKKRQMQQYFKDIDKAKERIERVAEEVEELQKKLPSNISDTQNLELIKGLAEGLNIKNVFLTPGNEENKGFYMVKRYDFNGTGTFLQFLVFLEKIAENDRLLNITSLRMKKTQKKQRGRFQLINCSASIVAYRYNSDHKEDRGNSKIESEFTGSVNKFRKKNTSNKKKK
jgi:Tfp pilus assembly protein PilO